MEVIPELMEDKKNRSRWNIEWLNKQLYGILAETSTAKLKETVMSREREVKTNGARIFRDLTRDYLDSSHVGIVALDQCVVKPVRATRENFEDRLRAWEEDVERCG